MATGKLTKARLVQILITLVVLIGAFVWRTLTYERDIVVTCHVDKLCQFRIEDQVVTLSLEKERAGIQHYILSPWQDGWSINVPSRFEYQPEPFLRFTLDDDGIAIIINQAITLKLLNES
ncbi:hypothetical protein ACF8CX_10225 [Vibrio mimicus]